MFLGNTINVRCFLAFYLEGGDCCSVKRQKYSITLAIYRIMFDISIIGKYKRYSKR